jgi:hypothetical protein
MLGVLGDLVEIRVDNMAEHSERDDGLALKSAPPSSCSRAMMALVSEGWETPQRLAAWVKVRSSQRARK